MDGVLALAERDAWAVSQFGTAELGARRRTKRLVQGATQMAGHTSGSIPQQTGSAARRKAACRLFDAALAQDRRRRPVAAWPKYKAALAMRAAGLNEGQRTAARARRRRYLCSAS